MDALVVALHLGALHPMETLAMSVLALGPFVILAVVVTIVIFIPCTFVYLSGLSSGKTNCSDRPRL